MSWIESCDSTMDEIKKISPRERQHGQWIATELQTQGRGRGSNHWSFLEGNLAVSIWLDQKQVGLPFTWVPLWLGYVLYSSILELKPSFSGRLLIKWPNDLLLDDKKVSGILCEGSSHWIAAGVGVNCVRSPDPLFSAELGLQAPILLESFLKNLEKGVYFSSVDQLRSRVSECLSFRPGDKICWSNGLREGVFEGIGADGELCVQSTGQSEKLWAEEVRHVRAAT